MLNAAKNIRPLNDIPSHQHVTIDGTWQTRDYSSLNGVVTAMINKTCVDFEVLSKFCFACSSWESKKGIPDYDEWRAGHKCDINNTTSSATCGQNIC